MLCCGHVSSQLPIYMSSRHAANTWQSWYLFDKVQYSPLSLQVFGDYLFLFFLFNNLLF